MSLPDCVPQLKHIHDSLTKGAVILQAPLLQMFQSLSEGLVGSILKLGLG